jgi:hypothetical protein
MLHQNFQGNLPTDAASAFSFQDNIQLKKLGRGGKDRPPGIILRRDRNNGPDQENSRTLAPPITNGPTSTVHSATAQPEGGAQDIVTRERMGHSEGIFFNQA